jgi:competence protein ComFB
MILFNQHDFENLKNESETHVFNDLAFQLENYPLPVCCCTDCIGDMAAIALNKVAPKYRWSLLGSLYTASAINDAAYRTSIREAVLDAIEIVRRNPSHDREHDGDAGKDGRNSTEN